MRKEFFGIGEIKRIRELIEELGVNKVFVVCGKKSFEKSGVDKKIMQYIGSFEKFSTSSVPNIDVVRNGMKLYKKFEPDLTLAVGGGSVIDTAKIINALANQDDDIISYIVEKKEIENEVNPLIAIPTTAGTGSEVTKFATIFINKKKYSLENERIIPDVAIVDPSLTFSMPPYVTAYSGLDALCQAIESYWSVNSTNESRVYAEESLRLSYKNIEEAVNGNTKARIAMAKSALLSGKAINISKTTACHSISYPLTAYFNIPHGHAVALTMPEFLEFNFEVDKKSCNDLRGSEFVKKRMEEIFSIIGVKDGKEAKERFRELLHKTVKKVRLRDFGIKKVDIDLILSESFTPDRINNNPRKVNRDDIKKIIENIW